MDSSSSQPTAFLGHYAHSLAGRPLTEWHVLEEHLTQTSELAECFASPFGEGWGRIAGLWHDAGKYQRAFQNRIGREPDAHTNERVDHSSVGALIAKEQGAPLVAFVVAGHHGGIPNADNLSSRLRARESLLPEARRDGLPSWIETQIAPQMPEGLTDRVQLS